MEIPEVEQVGERNTSRTSAEHLAGVQGQAGMVPASKGVQKGTSM